MRDSYGDGWNGNRLHLGNGIERALADGASATETVEYGRRHHQHHQHV